MTDLHVMRKMLSERGINFEERKISNWVSNSAEASPKLPRNTQSVILFSLGCDYVGFVVELAFDSESEELLAIEGVEY